MGRWSVIVGSLLAAAAAIEPSEFYDRPTMFHNPAMLLTISLCYAVPGIAFSLIANRLFAKLNFAFQLGLEAITPLVCLAAIMVFANSTGEDFGEIISGVISGAFTAQGAVIIIPACFLIWGVGIADRRRLDEKSQSGRFSSFS